MSAGIDRSCQSRAADDRAKMALPGPRAACDLGDERELALLHAGVDGVALPDRREPALRADRQLLAREVLRRLVDPREQLVRRLELGALRRHEAERHDLVV